jgi:hypothetical protein
MRRNLIRFRWPSIWSWPGISILLGNTIEQSLKTLGMEPGFAAAFSTLELGYEQTHRYEEAISALEKAREGSGGNPVSLA